MSRNILSRYGHISFAALLIACGTSSAAMAQSAPTPISLARTVNGTLATGDQILAADNSFYDDYQLALDAGKTILVSVQSTGFTPYVSVGANVGENCNDCELGVGDAPGTVQTRYHIGASGVAQIRVNTLAGAETGSYTITVTEVTPPALTVAQTLPYGRPVDLMFDGTEAKNDNDLNTIAVNLRLNQRRAIRITASGGGDLDPVLRLYDAHNVLVGEDDDGGPGLDSRISLPDGARGNYRLEVSNLNADAKGAITIQAYDAPAPIARRTRPITVGQTVNGNFPSDYDWVDLAGDPLQLVTYQVPVLAGHTYVFEVAGDQFRPEVNLDFADTEAEDLGTAADEDNHARIRFQVKKDTVITATIGQTEGTAGAYTLLLREIPAVAAPATGTPINVGARLSGRIDEASPQRPRGEAEIGTVGYQAYQVHLTNGQAITVRQVPEAGSPLDPYLLIGTGTPAAFKPLAEDDDSGVGFGARLNFVAPEEGDYLILASSFVDAPPAGYSLEVLPTATTPPQTHAWDMANQVQAVLTDSDKVLAQDDDGTLGQIFAVQVTAGQAYTFTARSTAFDTLLSVYRPGDSIDQWSQDDDGADEGTNSRLTYDAKISGTLYVQVASLDGTTGGNFSLSVTHAPIAPETPAATAAH